MSSLFTDRDDSEDLFRDTRMSFGDHLEELRWHLFRALGGAVMIMLLVFVLDGVGYAFQQFDATRHTWLANIGAGLPVMHFISRPVERELMSFYKARIDHITEKRVQEEQRSGEVVVAPTTIDVDRQALRAALGQQVENPGEPEWVPLRIRIRPAELSQQMAKDNIELIRPPLLSTLSITEAFMVYIKVSLVLGVVIGSPWIFYQIWAFIAAGLYPQEKHWVYVYGPFSLALFIAGVVLCEWLVIPAAVHYLLGFNEWVGLEPELRLSEWLSFALLTPLVFGIAFQTPLVMLFLHKVGIVDVSSFRQHRRYALFALALVAALLAASPDAFSMLALYIPLAGLYELGIILCRFSPKTIFDDVPESDEMVEV
jgi:sec-independent protein translocase protein TatC